MANDREVPAATVVLVHGAWGSPGLWSDVVEELRLLGIDPVLADLPTMRSPAGTLDDDAEHVRALAGDGPSVLVGHSYGGAVITEAGHGLGGLRHLVYVASVMPDAGESMFDWSTKRPTDGLPLELRDDGTAMVAEWGVDDGRYPERALRLLRANPPRPIAIAAALAPLTGAAWREAPSTFVLATHDTVVHPDTQRETATRAGRVVEMDCDHLVQGVYPAELAKVIAGVA